MTEPKGGRVEPTRAQRRTIRTAVEQHGGTIPREWLSKSATFTMVERMRELGWVEPFSTSITREGRRAAGLPVTEPTPVRAVRREDWEMMSAGVERARLVGAHEVLAEMIEADDALAEAVPFELDEVSEPYEVLAALDAPTEPTRICGAVTVGGLYGCKSDMCGLEPKHEGEHSGMARGWHWRDGESPHADGVPPKGTRVTWLDEASVSHSGVVTLATLSDGGSRHRGNVLVREDSGTVWDIDPRTLVTDPLSPLPKRVPAGSSAIAEARAELFRDGPCIRMYDEGTHEHEPDPHGGMVPAGACGKPPAAPCHATARVLHRKMTHARLLATREIAGQATEADMAALGAEHALVMATWWRKISDAAHSDMTADELLRDACRAAADHWEREAVEWSSRHAETVPHHVEPPERDAPPAEPTPPAVPAERPRRPMVTTQVFGGIAGPIGEYVYDNERTKSRVELLVIDTRTATLDDSWGVRLDDWLAEGRTLSRYVRARLDEYEYGRNPYVVILVAPRGTPDGVTPSGAIPIRWV